MLPPEARLLIRATLLLALLALAGPAAADRYETQRESFRKVLVAQKAGKHKLAGQLALGLEDYPLYPYYAYNDLVRRLHRYPVQQVARFLATYDNSYLAHRLRKRWLDQLAGGKRWQDFLRFYRPVEDLEMRCLQLHARLKSGLTEGLLADTRAIWLSGESLPDACDDAFSRLYASDLMNDDLLWARIRLTMQANRVSLARFLARRLHAPTRQAAATLWFSAHSNPAQVLRRTDLKSGDATEEILLHAVKRLARTDPVAAAQRWATQAASHSFSAVADGRAAASIALAAARSDHPQRLPLLDAVPDTHVDARIAGYRLREALLARDWARLAAWTAAPAPEGMNDLRWRYWRSRALTETGDTAQANVLFTELAGERDYYGFLAADQLQQDYQFNFAAVAPTTLENETIKTRPGIARSRELFLLDRKYQARREWLFEMARMSVRELEIAAHVAAGWGWPDSAIFALGRAKSYDDLDLRFPLLYAELARQYAAKRSLSAARIMAIIRSESAFVADARSGAGALGLMQLLPATARETARRIGLRLGSARELYDPKKNIALGSAYLAQMLKRHGDNFAMAAAAYNAGPHRVRQWRKAHCVPADIWVDTIPFKETRRYVRRAYFYTAIYESRMGENLTRIETVMPPIPAKGSNNIAGCQP